MGVLAMMGVIAAQRLGAGDEPGVRAAGEQGMIAAGLTSLPIMLCIWLLGPLLAFAQQDPQVVARATEYSRALTLAVLPALWFVVLRNYITALAHSAAVGWIMAAAVGLNLLVNYTLVFGHFGFPALGVAGAGIGTALVNWLMFLGLAAHVLRTPRLANLRPNILPRRLQRGLLREMFHLGLPNALTQIVSGAMFSAAAVLVGMLSAAALAAQQIVYSVLYLSLSAAAALADAVRVRVAYGIGTGNAAAARRSARICFALAAGTTLLAALALWLFPELLVGIFLDRDDPGNATVRDLSITLSLYAGVFLFLDGVQMVVASAIKGLRDTRSPLWISLLGYWSVGIGGGALLCFSFGFGIDGLWWGLVLGVALCNLLVFWRFRQRMREAARALAAGRSANGSG